MKHAGDSKTEAKFRLLLAESFWPFAFRLLDDEHVQPAQAAGREALALANELGRLDLVSAAYDALSSIDVQRGYYGLVLPVETERLKIARALGDPWEAGDAFHMAADTAVMVGELRLAAEVGSEGFDRSRTGPEAVWAACLSWRGIARFRLGEWAGASEDLRTLKRESARDSFATLSLQAACAVINELRGNDAQADQLLEPIVLDGPSGPRRPPAGFGRYAAYVARVRALRGDIDDALSMLEHSWERAQVRGLLLECECDIIAMSERWDRAHDTVARARAWADEAQLRALPLYADRLEGRAALAIGDTQAAVAWLSRARDGFNEIGARWDEAVSAMWLGEATNDRASIEAALTVFDDVGSIREIERARRLLG
jgi:hypothetical protein